MRFFQQKGLISPLLLISLAALGIVIYLLIAQILPFQDRLFSQLFPKPASKAFQRGESAPDELLLKFKPGVVESKKEAVKGRHKLTRLESLSQINVERLKVEASFKEKAIEDLKKDPAVLYAEPNYLYYAAVLKGPAKIEPNDPDLSKEWGMFKIRAADSDTGEAGAWSVTKGKRTIKIAILDSGIDQRHEDLRRNVVASINFTGSDTEDDIFGHGTAVAGIAAAVTDNRRGIASAGYDSTLINVKVLRDSDGAGFTSWIVNGINWAADNGAKVINISLSGPTNSSALEDAVNYAFGKGAVLVAASGNEGSSDPTYPASYNNVIAVAATDQNDQKIDISNYGTWVDVASPGHAIYTTNVNNIYGLWRGTSIAAPFVSGVAALIWAKGDCPTSLCVKNQIESTSDPITGTGSFWLWGRINALRAVTQAPPVIIPTPPPLIPSDTVSDTFTRANNPEVLGTTEVGGKVWTSLSGTWGIENNQGYTSDSCQDIIPGYAVLDYGKSDGILQIKLTNNPKGTRIPFRLSDSDNLYYLLTEPRFPGDIPAYGLWKKVKPQGQPFALETFLARSSSITPLDGDMIKLEFSGPNIKVYVNGNLIISVTDGSVLGSNFGIGFFGCGSQPYFDDFHLDKITL